MSELPSAAGGMERLSAAARGLVPTPRQQVAGEEGSTWPQPHTVTADEVPRASVGTRLAGWLHDLDPRSISEPKFPLFVFSLISFLAAWDTAALIVLLPDIRADLAISAGPLLVIGNIVGFVQTLLGPVGGYLADRTKRVRLVQAGAILGHVGSIPGGFAKSFTGLVAPRMGSGVVATVTGPAGYPLLTDYYSSRSRLRVFGFIAMAGAAGGIVGPFVAGELGQRAGWRTAMVTIAVVSTLVSMFTLFLREPKRGYLDRLEQGASEEVAETEKPQLGWQDTWRAAKGIYTLRRIWYATPFLYVGSLANGMLTLLWADTYHLEPGTRGTIFTLQAIVSMIGIAVGAPLGDRLLAVRPGRVMAFAGGLTVAEAVLFLVLAVTPPLPVAILMSLPIGFLAAMTGPMQAGLLSLVIPANMRGLGLTTVMPFTLIGTALIYGVIFKFGNLLGGPGVVLIAAPFLCVGGLILGTAAQGVERDMRAAKANAFAEEQVRLGRDAGVNRLLVCHDVDVAYDGIQVLFNVDLTVTEGEIVALLGTNGAGKSTLLRAIAGTQLPSNGAIYVDGSDVTRSPAYLKAARGIVMLPGGRAVFPTLSVGENLHQAAWLFKSDPQSVAAGIERVLEFFPVLRERWDQPAGNLSGGEQQMVALGQTLLMRPRLLMIDELSLGLAPAVVARLLDTLREIHRQGTTLILVEQSLNTALQIATRAVFMEKGTVRFDGPPQELLQQPGLVRAVFMGTAAAGGGARQRRTVPLGLDADTGPLLEADEVAVRFGGVTALRGVTISASAGEIVGVLGPNGAGKTTLFDCISGYIRPDAGSVRLRGQDVTSLSAAERARLGLGRSFQNARLFGSLTVRDNIAMARERHLKTRGAIQAALWLRSVRKQEEKVYRYADSLIRLLGLERYAEKYVDDLSIGTRRAVDIACTMANEPSVLLLDEPSSGLAQAESEALGPALTRLVRETNCALLIVEHDLNLLTAVADRLVAMELGAIVASGAPTEVLHDPKVVASYLPPDQTQAQDRTTQPASPGAR